ncbi:MAG: MFS transporter [Gammaproteobacteria bacterium]|nr:MFS transporter [Gammaproteobacteria bacterium]
MRPSAALMLMASVFAVTTGYGVVLPVLPFLLEHQLANPGAATVSRHTGMLSGAYMLALFVAAPLWGRLSDRIGRRLPLLLGLAGYVSALMMFTLSRELWLDYAARGLAGIFAAAVLPVALAYVGDTPPGAGRARAFAWLNTAALLGFLAGPLLGGWLATIGDPAQTDAHALRATALRAPFLVSALLGAFVWSASYLGLPKTRPHRSPRSVREGEGREAGAVPPMRLFALSFLVTLGLGSFEVALALRGRQVLGLGPADIALLFAVCMLLMIAVQGLIFTRDFAAIPARLTAPPTFAAMALGVLFLALAAKPVVVAILVGVIGAASGLLIPLIAYWVSLDAGAAQGVGQGKQIASASFGQALGSGAAGILAGVGAGLPFWVTGALLLVGSAIALTLADGARAYRAS